MRDTLDLQDLQDRVNKQHLLKQAQRRKLWITALGLMIVFVWLWVFLNNPDSPMEFGQREIYKSLLISFAPLISIGLGYFLWLRPVSSTYKEKFERTQKYLSSHFPQFASKEGEDGGNVIAQKQSATPFFGLIFIFILVLSPPPLIAMLLMLGYLVLLTTRGFITQLRDDSVSDSARYYLKKLIARRILQFGFPLTFIALTNAPANDIVAKLVLDPLLSSIISFVVIFSLSMLMLLGFNRVYLYQNYVKHLRQGDYDFLLTKLEQEDTGKPDYFNLSWRAMVHAIKGEGHQAIDIWERTFDVIPNQHSLAIAIFLNNIGYSHVMEKQYDEGLKYLEASIKLHPEYGLSYSNLAEWYQAQDLDPERALQLSQMAMDNMVIQRSDMLRKYMKTGYLTTHALALTNVGQFNEAQQVIQETLNQADTDFVFNMGQTYLTMGQIKHKQGEDASARELFARSVETDPNSYYGQVARNLLAVVH